METEYNPPHDPLVILHEDAEVLLVDKPAGLLSVPGKGPHLADCLIARVQDAFPDALLVHRLDRDTSGVMIFALTPYAQRHLGLQFEKRMTRKTYVARVWGVPMSRAHEPRPMGSGTWARAHGPGHMGPSADFLTTVVLMHAALKVIHN